MKNLILISAVVVLSACATTPTVKSVAGTYEFKKDGVTLRAVLLENGIVESYYNGKKDKRELKWKISEEGELHFTFSDGYIYVYRINKDRSITIIAQIGRDGEREDYPKERQLTFKKIK